jgi:uncharacterized membrane protein
MNNVISKPARFSISKTFGTGLPCMTILLFGILYLVMVFCNHYFFRTWAWDYGSYNFGFYDYAHFRISESPLLIPHMSFLQDHVSFTFMLFIPLYWLFAWITGTYTLSILQTLIILLGGLALYKLLEFKTSSRLLSWLALIQYFTLYGRWASFCSACNLAIIAASAVPIFLYYFEKKRFLPAFLVLVFIFLGREDTALWTAFIGLFLLISHFRDKQYRRASIMVILSSLSYFIFIFAVVIPLLESSYVKYSLFNYTALGSTPLDALAFIIRHPVKCIELLFTNPSGIRAYDTVKIEFYFVYLISGGFLLFYRPRYLLLFIPLVLKKMYNDAPIRWSIESYYSIEVVTILPIAVFLIISEIKSRLSRQIIIALVCTGSIGMTVFKLLEKGRELNYVDTNFAFYRSSMYKADFDVKSVHRNLTLIPPEAAVSSSGTLNPHLAFRPKDYYFPRVDDAEYIAVMNGIDTWPLEEDQFREEIKKYTLSEDWEILVDDYPLLILHRIK